MNPAAATLEDRIRERAYHLWEANGRPSGRDQEFWHQACTLITTAQDKPRDAPQRQVQPPRKRSRKPARQTDA